MRIAVRGGRGFDCFAIAGSIMLSCSSLANSASAATAPSVSEEMPAALAPFVVDGRFRPGSFEWLRWSFSADPEEKARWKQLVAWAAAKAEARKKAVASDLTALGVGTARARGDCFDDEACGWIMVSGFLTGLPSWTAAEKALLEARPAAEGYILAVEAMERQAREETTAGSAVHELLTRTRAEQMLRAAMMDRQAMPQQLSAEGKRAWQMFIWREIARRDNDNTRWLKGKVAKDGWPRRSVVGAEAAHAAWLLAQHADRDPAFQLQALRLMEPLVAANEVTPKDYAYLYDRVVGELRGRQRYGTQMICTGGKFAPQPIEDPANLDKRRLAVGLSAMREQVSKYADRTC